MMVVVHKCSWVFACDSERCGHCGKSPTNSTKNLASYPVYNYKKSM